MAYHIDIDRELGTLRFQQGNLIVLIRGNYGEGCGCSPASVYPTIKTTMMEINDTAVPSSSLRSKSPSCKNNQMLILTL